MGAPEEVKRFGYRFICSTRLVTCLFGKGRGSIKAPMQPVIALLSFAVLGLAAAFSILPVQSRRERQDRLKTSEDDWAESGFLLSRAQFEMCRVMPTTRSTVAEYVFEDESRHEFGRYISQSRFRADIVYGGRSATLYIQGSGINRSRFAGKLGATRPNSIVIRDENSILAEIIPSVVNGQLNYEIRSPKLTLTLRTPRWRVFNAGTVFDGDQEVAEYRRLPGVSRRVLVAQKRDLPLESKLWICCLALLR